jgi:uncharacterized protein (DUF1697 family)
VPTWVSLLRAVNLGARNKVSMPILRKALEAAGLEDVRTYVQSGNIVSRSRHRRPAAVSSVVHDVIKSEFGLDILVVVRTPEQLAAVIAANPFAEAARDRPKQLAVSFLAGKPKAAAVDALLAEPAAADVCRVVDDNLYIDYEAGVHGSRLTPAFLERRLGVEGTARNWRTVLALADLTG